MFIMFTSPAVKANVFEHKITLIDLDLNLKHCNKIERTNLVHNFIPATAGSTSHFHF